MTTMSYTSGEAAKESYLLEDDAKDTWISEDDPSSSNEVASTAGRKSLTFSLRTEACKVTLPCLNLFKLSSTLLITTLGKSYHNKRSQTQGIEHEKLKKNNAEHKKSEVNFCILLKLKKEHKGSMPKCSNFNLQHIYMHVSLNNLLCVLMYHK